MEKIKYTNSYFQYVIQSQLEKDKKTTDIFISRKSVLEPLLKVKNIQRGINFLTSHRLRQTLIFFLKFSNQYVIAPEEKIYSLDFLNYCLKENPKIPFDLFPKSDRKEIETFIKNKFLVAITESITKNDLDVIPTIYKDGNVRYNFLTGIYNILGFKTKNYGYSYNVFTKKCGIKFIRNIRKIKELTIIDGGAYDGDSAWILNKYLKPNIIFAFEPNRANFTLLKENIKKNNMKNVMPYCLGLGEKRQLLRMNPNGGSSTVSKIGKDKIEIEAIDNFSEAKNQKVGLIKLDVEGFEMEVLKGAEKTIIRNRPVLLISIYHRGQDLFEIPKYLRNLVPSYKFRFVNLDPSHATLERVVIAQI